MMQRNLKILITGKNRKVMKDVAEHLEDDRGYMTLKCDPSKSALYDITLAELPKVIIICMGDETVESVSVYDVVRTAANQGNCTIIVIANEEDEKFFIKYTHLDRVLFLSRPVSLFALYEKLSEIEEKLENDRENNLSAFREFVNERKDEEVHHRKHILVVDDDPEQLFHIKNLLSEFYDVTLVKSGDQAFIALTKNIPDLILLDYLMPGMDGPEVLRELRSTDFYSTIPVIFLTGMTEKSAVLQTIKELRPEGYVIKPSKKSELVAKIIDVLG